MERITLETVRAMDGADPLAGHREGFLMPAGVVYLDGNSLGPLPAATVARVEAVVRDEWGRDLITSWERHGWLELPMTVGERIAPLVGAAPGQVVAADSTSVNLFKLLGAALRLRPGRPVILTEEDNFPTDLYVAQGLIDLLGGAAELRMVPRDGLEAAMDASTAVLLLTHVDFRTGWMHDMGSLTRIAHASGVLALWDLSHSAGAVPLELDRWGVDLAVGCGYKFLNGGPGAPAFLYVARRHQEDAVQPVWGWLGHEAPFAFERGFRGATGVRRYLCGTPPILSLAALQCGVELTARAEIGAVRRKSVALGDLFIALMAQECKGSGFELASPADPGLRGSQVSFRHPEAFAVVRALGARGVIADFREPDIARFGLSPLCLRFEDVWTAVVAIRDVMASGAWENPAFHRRGTVT